MLKIPNDQQGGGKIWFYINLFFYFDLIIVDSSNERI